MTRTRTAALTAVAALALGSVPIGLSVAGAATRSAAVHGGVIHAYAQSTSTAATTQDIDLITGAFSDHGHDTTSGPGGTTVTLHLTKGTIVLNATNFDHSTNVVVHSYDASCSDGFHLSGTVTAEGGTGAYVGAHGTLATAGVFAYQGHITGGKCNLKAHPVAASTYITVQGTIGF